MMCAEGHPLDTYDVMSTRVEYVLAHSTEVTPRRSPLSPLGTCLPLTLPRCTRVRHPLPSLRVSRRILFTLASEPKIEEDTKG